MFNFRVTMPNTCTLCDKVSYVNRESDSTLMLLMFVYDYYY